jgi:predicted nucleic-acid-binding protein
VQVETVWVLESGYELSKDTIAEVLEHLEVNQAFVLEHDDLCHRALELFRSSNVDYSDCVILSNCLTRKLTLYTFDKPLSKLTGADPLPPI